MPASLRAAAVQFAATPFAPPRNLLTAERLVRVAATQGARLIVLPELFNTGYVYSPQLSAAAEPPDGPTAQWLTRLSAELRVILAGTWLVREAGHIYNALHLAQPDGRLHVYFKRHPFLWENFYFQAGQTPLIVETDFGRVGLLVGWDMARTAAWEPYRGNVDLMVIASAPPRFHRAVINFPLGKKVYLAELMPVLLRERTTIDQWYLGAVAQQATRLGVPIVHSVMAGRFVTETPWPRRSFLLACWQRPRYWSWIKAAGHASLRATFYGTSAIFSASGATLAQAHAEEALAVAEVQPGAQPPALAWPTGPFVFTPLPPLMRWL